MARSALPRQVRIAAKVLLARGCSQREVARRLGLSRKTVWNLLHGRRGEASSRASCRCPGCGGLLSQWPCVLCRTRRHQSDRREGRRPGAAGNGTGIRISLRGEQRKRYLELRRRKRDRLRGLTEEETAAKYEQLRLVRGW